MKTVSVIAAICLSSTSDAFQQGVIRSNNFQRKHRYRTSPRGMKSSTTAEVEEGPRTGRRFEPASQLTPYKYNDRSPTTSLSVATLGGLPDAGRASFSQRRRLNLPDMRTGNLDAVAQVLSAALLITGNTVGPSMFVLPESVGGVGMAWGSAIFFGLYLYNLISGLLLADVAISLHENSGCAVPSSFKDFVDTAMESEVAGTAVAGASLISNSCFLAFGAVHAGSLLRDTFPGLGLDPTFGAGAFAAMIALFSVTQTNKGLGLIANASTFVLFSSFLSLLLPSVAKISDPVGLLSTPSTSPDGIPSAAAIAIPLVLSSLSYQNIVPSITKLLDFDRMKSYISVALGSFIPMAMMMAWCFAVVGGGVDDSAGAVVALTAFSASALVGSCIAAVMSLAEEYESIITSLVENEDIRSLPNKFSLSSVALSMAPPVAVALAFSKGGDLTSALRINGAFIMPFLYGLLPIALYQTVQKRENSADTFPSSASLSSVPQALLLAGTVGTLGQEVIQDLPKLIA